VPFECQVGLHRESQRRTVWKKHEQCEKDGQQAPLCNTTSLKFHFLPLNLLAVFELRCLKLSVLDFFPVEIVMIVVGVLVESRRKLAVASLSF
jgi:hypothetical protein